MTGLPHSKAAALIGLTLRGPRRVESWGMRNAIAPATKRTTATGRYWVRGVSIRWRTIRIDAFSVKAIGRAKVSPASSRNGMRPRPFLPESRTRGTGSAGIRSLNGNDRWVLDRSRQTDRRSHVQFD